MIVRKRNKEPNPLQKMLSTARQIAGPKKLIFPFYYLLRVLSLRKLKSIPEMEMNLFGKRFLPDYPQCELRLARFRGLDKTEFLDQRQLRGPAFRLLEEAERILEREHAPHRSVDQCAVDLARFHEAKHRVFLRMHDDHDRRSRQRRQDTGFCARFPDC